MTTNRKAFHVTRAAIIAALYVSLTYISFSFGLSGGVIQIRISECLCILPFFTFDAISGLFIGCILANIFTGCNLIDIIFGSLATLIGAYFTYLISKTKWSFKIKKWIAPLPSILSNTLIIPFIISYAYTGTKQTLPFVMLTIGIGELISAGIFGFFLLIALYPKRKMFMQQH